MQLILGQYQIVWKISFTDGTAIARWNWPAVFDHTECFAKDIRSIIVDGYFYGTIGVEQTMQPQKYPELTCQGCICSNCTISYNSTVFHVDTGDISILAAAVNNGAVGSPSCGQVCEYILPGITPDIVVTQHHGVNPPLFTDLNLITPQTLKTLSD